MAATPSGHLDFGSRAQQPTSTSNRTSDESQNPIAPTLQRHIPAPSSGSAAAAAAVTTAADPSTSYPTVSHSNSMPMSILANQSRVESSIHHPHTHPTSPYDLGPHSGPTTASLFARPSLPSGIGHLPVDWSIYGPAGHPGIPLNPTGFHFEVPSHNAISTQFAHHPHSDPSLAGAYGSELVSPTSIHHGAAHVGHYPFGSSWDDSLGHESTTPTVTTPAAVTVANPWVDPNEVQIEEESPESSRRKQKGRSKRPKRDAGESSGAPSTEATSPSSASQHSRASIGSKSASNASTSTTSSRPSRLRSASRTSKNNVQKPNDTPEDRRTRASHNLVEKQYRNRLNSQFESLLSAIPEQIRQGGEAENSDGAADLAADRRVSKGEVLEMARKHIQSLERERDILEKEKNELLGSLRSLKGSFSSEGTTSSSQGTPIDFNINMNDDKTTGEEEMERSSLA